MKTQPTERHPYREGEDINLMVVYQKIGSFFKYIGNSFSYLFQVIKKRIKSVILFAVLGVLTGYGAYLITKPFYTSSMTLMLSEIRNEFVEDQLDKLSDMIKEDNFDAIAEQLEISTKSAMTIKEMKFSNLDQDRVKEDSILTGSPFRIELTIYDNRLFSSLEPAITNYLENNRYFSKLKRIRRKEVESMIGKLQSDIVSIDSIKSTVISPRGPVNGFVYGEPLDPTNLYKESLTMYQQQVSMEAELDQLNNIEVVNGFYSRNKPSGPRLLLYLLTGGLAFTFLGIFIALMLESKKREV
jgi:uncharacterized protein involved in exopolysaccharide biosynthesis